MSDARSPEEETPNPLDGWYRYVESVSRPAVRGEEAKEVDLPEPRPWRPWSEVQSEARAEAAQQDPSARAEQFLEHLVPRLPTVEELKQEQDVQLPALPIFETPKLNPPRLDVRINRLAGFLAPALAAETGVKGGLSAASTALPLGAVGLMPRHWEILARLPSDEVTQNSYKSQFKESREELVSRLLDPPLTLEETARLLGVCPTTVRRYTNKGLLRHFRTNGNQRRFHLSDVLQFIERRADEISDDARRDAQAAQRRGRGEPKGRGKQWRLNLDATGPAD